jgi:hypothetical protein
MTHVTPGPVIEGLISGTKKDNAQVGKAPTGRTSALGYSTLYNY